MLISKPPRFSELSAKRQALVRICQTLSFGEIHNVCVRKNEPILESASLLAHVRLDIDEVPRPEIALEDFELAEEVSRLMERLDEIENGTIARLEVRGGVPR